MGNCCSNEESLIEKIELTSKLQYKIRYKYDYTVFLDKHYEVVERFLLENKGEPFTRAFYFFHTENPDKELHKLYTINIFVNKEGIVYMVYFKMSN